jgi:steroid delta-isomerase-like uncharacterized protein
MTDETTALIHRWFEEIWNKGRIEAVDEMLAPDCISHGLTGPDGNPPIGPSAFVAVVRSFRTAFPDLRIIVEETVTEGDKVAVRCLATGTHTGKWISLEPTNRPVAISGMCMVRVQDGKIAEAWNNFDFVAMYRQLGVLDLGES